ncbi:uncharacterized protein LOC135163941 [Diachasmimorpha longicaudata]|uniref:uncharacterized protein LOC135163941 n=1 Tax=Diachasmimorpha longicaudata TaxID=58733 RepID=UPI0030B8F226
MSVKRSPVKNKPAPSTQEIMPTENTPLSTLRRRRGNIQGAIRDFQAFVETYEKVSVEERIPEKLQAAWDGLERRYEPFEDIQDQIEDLDEEEQPRRFEIQAMYDDVHGEFLRLNTPPVASTLQENLNQSLGSGTSGQQSGLILRLPKLDFGKFDGKVEKWPMFYDSFMATIDSHIQISPVEKLQHLRTHLEGPAAEAIASLRTTDANYAAALEILKEKYEDKEKIILSHWQRLVEYPRSQRDTPQSLGKLVDTLNSHLMQLKNLDQKIVGWDIPLVHLILSKITQYTASHWDLHRADQRELPKYTELLTFLKKRSKCSRPIDEKESPSPRYRREKQTFLTTTTTNEMKCGMCKENHSIMRCLKFKAFDPKQRYTEAKKRNLCINCLAPGHTVTQCNLRNCSVCQEGHNTLLHREGGQSSSTSSRHTSLIINASTCELMVTAKIRVNNNKNEFINCRALLDTCSTTNLISERLATILELPRKNFSASIGGLHNLTTSAQQLVTTTVKSRINNETRRLTFLIIPSISTSVPDQPLNRNKIKIPKHVKLADPDFHRPAPVDMLIGTGSTIGLLGMRKMRLSPEDQPELYLLETALGYVVGGGAPTSRPVNNHSCHFTTIKTPEFDLSRFWEIEEPMSTTRLKNNDAAAEQHYKDHVTRDCTGRYIVALPFNDKIEKLGESRSHAYHRWKSCERNLKSNPDFAHQYHAVLQEYLDLGHMAEVSPFSLIHYGYYLPHHAVFKEDSLTTKVRVVFDGSAKTNSAISLNDTLHIGPTIQEDIFSLLVRFRIHRYVVTADIEKMYRQVLIHPQDRKYQRILWRTDDGPIKTFQLNTVTFGLSAAPYLAIRTIHQLINDDGHLYPAGARALKTDCYVDDLISGADTKEGAIAIQRETENLVQRGGFKLRQWASNDPSLLHETLKTLGLSWNSTDDSIKYFVKPSAGAQTTKRLVLSETARLFDPLGLLAPVVIVAKTFIQKLWELKIDWDTPLPLDIKEEWNKFYEGLPLLETINFPRGARINAAIELQIHGFCDASQIAYGACVYLRSKDKDGNVNVSLLCAKSRVAPLKKQTIPRLELCGALLLTSLIESVTQSIHHKIDRVCYWTDSTVVLHWLHISPNKLPVFLAGPPWLSSEEHSWPTLELQFSSPALEERKAKISVPTQICPVTFHRTQEKITRQGNVPMWFSSIKELQRIIAYCLRMKNHNTGRFSVEELEYALQGIIHWVQQENFIPVITALRQDKKTRTQLSEISKFSKLSPFLDTRGLLRVGSRLRHATVSFDQGHPLILPKRHHITNLIIRNEHIEHLHAGSQTTLYAVRRRFWPLDGRNVTRHLVRSCVKCIRHNPPPVDYVMGSLPRARATESRPFSHVELKVGLSVFVCLAIKAVHLEVVSDLSTETFIAALRRFILRRGICTDIYSDNGTNFVGANNKIRQIYVFLKKAENENKIQNYISSKSIQWHFIPPQLPHFGGLWEAAVKSFKYHLKRIINDELLSLEAFNTFVIEIEGVLHSRPITPISSDPNDLIALTPGHFLIGDSLTSLRSPNFQEIPTNRLSSWQHVQKLKQHFWARWHREYISELSLRSKWMNGEHFIKKDTMVLIKEDHLPAQQWAIGRVVHVYPREDGIIRTVTVRTSKGTFNRNVKKLAPLFYEPHDDNRNV